MVQQIWSKEHQQVNSGNDNSIMPTTTTTAEVSTGEVNGASSSVKEKKKRGLLGLKSPFKFMGGGKTYCRGCKKKCSGEVLRVNDVYFHTQCFQCRGCGDSLSQGGFFTRDRDYFCARCYQTNWGTKCFNCLQFVEGEVVTALGKTYHQNCFTCAGCRKPFPTGERVTFTGKQCLCQRCVRSTGGDQAEVAAAEKRSPEKPPAANGAVKNGGPKSATAAKPATAAAEDICAGCNEELRDGQALMALDKQYHVWCFKCKACDSLLHGEYMGKDGHPYCEKDYQQLFGVKCTYCRRFISGKVLQAGDNNHFHPTCARCTKCGDPFGDGEEMFLQGAAIWHPRCGPGPDDSTGGFVVNGFDSANATYQQHHDHADGTSMASAPFFGSRASSPGASLRRSADPYYDSGRFSRSTTHVGYHHSGVGGALYSSSSTYSLRRPLEPGDRIDSLANVNHFHLPPSRRASSTSRYVPRMSVEHLPAAAAAHRPISCPPKPGYTHMRTAGSSAISPGPGMHFNDFGRGDDVISQQSFRTDYTEPFLMRPSSTYSHGFRTPLPGRPETPVQFTGEHKVYPLHVLFTSNYKLPPDLDRCNLDKHLSDADFGLAFGMQKHHFYSLPLWKRNDMKRRVKLF